MMVTCKKCGKDLTKNVIQILYNKSIKEGYKNYDSSGNLITYKKVETCKC